MIQDSHPLREALKIFIPSFLAVALFVGVFFLVVLPWSRTSILAQKKDAIAIQTDLAWNILQYHHQKSLSGELTLQEAREDAIEQLRGMRFGKEGKDYFWINDTRPVMIMHPYRPELEGQDVAGLADREGNHLFQEMVRAVAERERAFVPYIWQYNDEQTVSAHKLSSVRLFAPWGWIVGTGLYLDEVDREIRRISRETTIISAIILTGIIALNLYISRISFLELRRRRLAEDELAMHHEQLEELVAARTADLTRAMQEIKTLSGFLPICASCKKIRDDKGYWNQIETYIRERTDARFSHGICPDCAEKLYPGYFKKTKSDRKTEES
ncbi:MAG: cache domain-containing protein [Thermodesulfobacteriota bacterium]